MNKIRAFFKNKWVGFSLAAILYTLWFVVWTGNLWLLLGLPLIFDLYITGYFYRFVWCRNARMCERSRIYKTAYEWINAIVFATVVATLAHIFIFQLYVIPSSSMEKSLLTGDYLFVSKVAYGPQMPNTPVSFPFVHHTMPFSDKRKSFSEIIRWPYHRLKGLGKVERNDVVVFNFPAGDTVLLERQNETYYDILRRYQATYGREEGRRRLRNEYTVASRPVDKRENYVKRCVALPGDTLQIVETDVYIDGELQPPIAGKQFIYLVETTTPFPSSILNRLGITEYSRDNALYYMALTEENARRIGSMNNVTAIRKLDAKYPMADVFPHERSLGWNQDNYGPIWIPSKGSTVRLTPENLPLYRRIIEIYEGNTLETDGERILINGEPTEEYTFRMDYYWMMGDNRHNSADSRFWGFVPEDHIVGKASFVWLSLDREESFPKNIRWNRIFKRVD